MIKRILCWTCFVGVFFVIGVFVEQPLRPTFRKLKSFAQAHGWMDLSADKQMKVFLQEAKGARTVLEFRLVVRKYKNGGDLPNIDFDRLSKDIETTVQPLLATGTFVSKSADDASDENPCMEQPADRNANLLLTRQGIVFIFEDILFSLDHGGYRISDVVETSSKVSPNLDVIKSLSSETSSDE